MLSYVGMLLPLTNVAILFKIFMHEINEMMNSSCHRHGLRVFDESEEGSSVHELGRPVARLLFVSSDFESCSTKNVCIHDLFLALYILRTTAMCVLV